MGPRFRGDDAFIWGSRPVLISRDE